MKNALGDWRLPLIFAVPVALVAIVGYLALQPPPGTREASLASNVTIHENVTPRPTYVPTPYPSVEPSVVAVIAPIPCTDPSTVTAFHATAGVRSGNLVITVTDQRGRLVVCAWAIPQGGNHAVGGFTDQTGTITYPMSALPADDYFVDLIKMKGMSAVTEVSFRR